MADHLTHHARRDLFHRRFHAPQQLPFRFPTTNRQHAMTGNGAQRLRIIEVVFVLRVVAGLARHHTTLHHPFGTRDLAHPAADQRVLGHLLRENIPGALQRRLYRGHLRRFSVQLRQQVPRRRGQRRRIIQRPTPHPFRQRPKSAFTGNHGACTTLGLEGKIEILQRLFGVHRQNGGLQRSIKLALFVNTLEHRRPTLLKFVQILGALADIAQLHLVQSPGDFLPVSGDKRKSGPLSKEGKRALNLLRVQREFRRDTRNDGGSKRLSHVRGFYAADEPNSTACVSGGWSVASTNTESVTSGDRTLPEHTPSG